MNKEHKNVTKKKALELKQTKMLKSSHVLIAIVALIECLILLTFTTYSWIESSSSLVIMNGPKSAVNEGNVNLYDNIDIADTLDYRININTDGTLTDINNFFRKVKYYEFAKGTSSDGVNIFFPRRNNTHVNATDFRRGDTTDYNTSYYYFDFVVNNNTRYGKDFYFDEDYIFTVNGQKTIFNATSSDSDLTAVYGDSTTNPNNYTRLDALRGAMRMSISTQIGSGATDTKMFSSFGTSGYKSINANVTPYNDTQLSPSGSGSEVTTHTISQYVYAETDGTPTSSKLFNARKSKETKVSVRMWFDMLDPDFQTAFGFSTTTHSFDTDLFAKIPDAVIGVKFALKCTDNDYQAVYFDDYTFSNVANTAHLTDEHNNYSMWFYAYQPATTNPVRTAGYKWLKMTKDDAASQRNRWYTGEATLSMMGTETGEGMQGTYLTNAKFVYAPQGNNNQPNTSATGVYTWTLPAAPPDDYYFNAYSYTPYWNSGSGSATYYGSGVWDDGDTTSMVYLTFKDMATGTTDVAFNGSSGATKSFQYMNYAAENASRSVIYVDNDRASTPTFTADKTIAAMHYNDSDPDDTFFESYVPKKWLSGSTAGAYFNYCPDGYYGKYYTTQRWSGLGPNNTATGTYTYTALGYTNAVNNNAWVTNYGNHSTSTYFAGVGTWGEIEKINFSTELIDSDHIADYRYFIGITGYSSSNFSSTMNYYPMTPDATNMIFSAYVPKDIGKSDAGAINFIRYNTYRAANHTTASINARWFGNRRNECSTFYPISINTSTTTDYTRGYWNLSVLIDGSYENLIYATVVTDNATSGGTLQYSTDGSTWSSAVMIDRYRWAAPADGSQTISTIYWKWTPYQSGSYTKTVNGTTTTVNYDATVFNYTHNLSDGLYKVVTEKPNEVTATGIQNGPPLQSGASQDDTDIDEETADDTDEEIEEPSDEVPSEETDGLSDDYENETYDYTEEE